jgi:reverse gyrase
MKCELCGGEIEIHELSGGGVCGRCHAVFSKDELVAVIKQRIGRGLLGIAISIGALLVWWWIFFG